MGKVLAVQTRGPEFRSPRTYVKLVWEWGPVAPRVVVTETEGSRGLNGWNSELRGSVKRSCLKKIKWRTKLRQN